MSVPILLSCVIRCIVSIPTMIAVFCPGIFPIASSGEVNFLSLHILVVTSQETLSLEAFDDDGSVVPFASAHSTMVRLRTGNLKHSK